MLKPRHVLMACSLFLLATMPQLASAEAETVEETVTRADTVTGFRFYHQDWEVACDNTRTCRAAGYQTDDDTHPMSVLLTRPAGINQPFTGQIQLGSYDEEPDNGIIDTVRLHINQQDFGTISMAAGSDGKLSTRQVNALVRSAQRHSDIRFSNTEHNINWRLSDAGISAALLKIDDFQGRLLTPNAAIKTGNRPANRVLPAIPEPIYTIANYLPDTYTPAHRIDHQLLYQAWQAMHDPDDCSADPLNDKDSAHKKIIHITDHYVTWLTDTQFLFSRPCWLAAYNYADRFWLVTITAHQPPQYTLTYVADAHDFDQGQLHVGHKGRGLGDCWSMDTWSWVVTHNKATDPNSATTAQFVHTQSANSGMCKLVAAGGAWYLPTLVSDVRQPATIP